VLGFVLRLRGSTGLHASAVAVDGQALVLVGEAGAGKSTTAAAFAQLGFPVISDDIVALSDNGRSLIVQPGYPRVRLWPESVNALYGVADALPRLTPSWNKRYLDLTQTGYHFQQRPLPLAAVYILGERIPRPGAPFVTAMRSHPGLIALVANTYANRLLDTTMRSQEFELLSRLVNRVPLRRINPHADPARLAKLCDVIVDDFRSLICPATEERLAFL
jgi:energy-coupling factor transporter ATP-binding protein EcfA2